MKTHEIRNSFLKFFEDHDHKIIESSSLVPKNDPTLLFTNAGMVQFKDVFLGEDSPPYARAVTDQRCVRAGGKHNDLENVGYTARHHTFFEMLGNFSFGDYFKHEAIGYAWELLTNGFGLPPEKLWVTVFEEDDEAADIWLNEIGISSKRFSRIGAKDNFWAMGDTGPCGPCSEIFFDHGNEVAGGPPGSPEAEGDRYVEIWNLVFMQYSRNAEGHDSVLPQPSVDTGLGLERLAAVLQGVHSNYETDLFVSLIEKTANILNTDQLNDHSLKVIADHIRSTSFLVVDGVIPSNEGRGYVLRRIIRRAIRHGYRLGCREPFLQKLVAPLAAEMGNAYPELTKKIQHVEGILLQEGEKFLDTLEQGIRILDQEITGLTGKIIPGEIVFRLYDTYGFPADLTADVARERGLKLDMPAFDCAMKDQRERARAANQFQLGESVDISVSDATEFLGYDTLNSNGKVSAILFDGQEVEILNPGEAGWLILDQTPFYAEAGGQVGDQGQIYAKDSTFRINGARYVSNKVIAHVGVMEKGSIRVKDQVTTSVNSESRRSTMSHHSATHLLHAALQETIGQHVEQKGSLVEPNRLRFDFSHSEPIEKEVLDKIEKRVNDEIRLNHEVVTRAMDIDDAKAEGAGALFGEKYEKIVRVVGMGTYSLELCGGTHVQRTGDIGTFRIIAESGVAAGVRRIEAVTGEFARCHAAEESALLSRLSEIIRTSIRELEPKALQLQKENRELHRKIAELQEKIALGEAGLEAPEVQVIGDVSLIVLRKDGVEVAVLRALLDKLRDQLNSGIIVVGGVREGKATLLAGVTASLTNLYPAGSLIAHLAPIVGGRGGGKPDMAQGGGTEVNKIDEALSAVTEWIISQQH